MTPETIKKPEINEVIKQTRSYLGQRLYSLLDGAVDLPDFTKNIILRARSWAKSAYFRLQYNNNENSEIQKLTDYYHTLCQLLTQRREAPLSQKKQIDLLKNFLYQISTLLVPERNQQQRNRALKEVLKAESYIVRFHADDKSAEPDLVLAENANFTAQYQTTRLNNPLLRLQQIYENVATARPVWFRKLPLWQQQFITDAAQANRYELLTRKTPTAGNWPGLSNDGCDTLTINHEQSTIYYLSAASKHTRDEAITVMKDYFYQYREQMIANFQQRQPDSQQPINNIITIPLLIDSLLTPTPFDFMAGENNNTRMLAFKAAAIRELQAELNEEKNNRTNDAVHYHFQLINNNHALNGWRDHQTASENARPALKKGCEVVVAAIDTITDYDATIDADFKQKLIQIKDLLTPTAGGTFYFRKLRDAVTIANILDTIASSESKTKYALFIDTLKSYTDAWRSGPSLKDDENFELHLVSCEAILIQEAGGSFATHCKSGKDRVGNVKAKVTQQRLLYAEKNVLHNYSTDSTPAHETVLKGCYQQITPRAGNYCSPGSAGIKDDLMKTGPKIVCALRNIIWWVPTLAKYMPEFFRRAGDQKRDAAARAANAFAGISCLLFPYLAGPIIAGMSHQAMAPNAVLDDQFNTARQLAKLNKLKAKPLQAGSQLDLAVMEALQRTAPSR